MSKEGEDQSSEEPPNLEGSKDEFCKCSKSKIKYTRALLLEFTEVEACRELPGDFELLILRQLGGASDGTVEHERISENSSLYGSLSSTRWNLGFPCERWDNNLSMPSKGSYTQGNSSSERSDAVCQQLSQDYGYNAGASVQKIQKSDHFQLRNSGNPYHPPHKKMRQPLDTFSELAKESLQNSSFSAVEADQRASADGPTRNEKSGYGFPVGGVDDSINSPLDDEGSGIIGANEKLELRIIEENQLTFDDYWAEILEILQLQQEPKLTPVPTHDDTPDPEVEIGLPDECSFKVVVDFINLDNSDDIVNSEAGISLLDEDSSISIDDMIAHHNSMSTLSRDLVEADKVTSNMAVHIRKNSGSVNTKGDNSSTILSSEVQSVLDFSGLVTHGKLHSQLCHDLQKSTDTFGPAKPFLCQGIDQMNFLTKFMASNIVHYIPTLNWFTCSNFHHRPRWGNPLNKTKTNNSLVQYSVLQQPSACPEQVATPDLNPMHFLHLTSPQTTHQGFAKSNADVSALLL